MTPKRRANRAAVYARRSEAAEKRGSVPGQIKRCKGFANEEGWTTVEFVDDGISGWDTGVRRDGYESMLRAIRAGDVDTVVIDKPDRLTRQDSERADFERLYAERGLRMLYTSDGSSFDLGTAEGRRRFRDAGTTAAYYSDLLSERVSAAMDEVIEGGWWSGGARPFGYDVVPAEEHKTLRVREDEAEVLRELYGSVLDGRALKGLAKELNHRSIRTARGNEWTAQAVRQTLLSPRNAGLREHRGELGRATWPAIVDQRTWRRVRTLLEDPSRKVTYRSGRYTLVGLVHCAEHGTRMTGRPIGGVPYYDCPEGHHLAIKAEPFEEYVNAECGEHELMVGAPKRERVPDPREVQGPILTELGEVERKLADWARRSALGEVEDVEYQAARGALAERRRELAKKLDELTAPAPDPEDEDLEDFKRRIKKVKEEHGGEEAYFRMLERQRAEMMTDDILVKPANGRGRWARLQDRVEIRWRSYESYGPAPEPS